MPECVGLSFTTDIERSHHRPESAYSEGRRPAVFLDRDGTLVEDRGHLRATSEVVFFPETFDALRKLQQAFALFIVTHQPGVSQKTVSMEDVDRINDHIVSKLAAAGVNILATYVCPHRQTDGCPCIKPKPHFLRKAAEDFGIDLPRSFVIGDHPHDVMLARNAGAQGLYVCTGHGLKHLRELPEDALVVGDIGEAADCILLSSHKPRGWKAEIERAAEIIRQGGVVAFPTETVYGLGADAFNALAVARVFEVKQRPLTDPVIVHIADADHLKSLAASVPDEARLLADRFWPGPLTLVLPKTPGVPDIVTAGLGSVGVRLPDHPLALALIRACQTPVAAPSANLFGHVSPTRVRHVRDQIGGAVDAVLDGGPCRIGIESTIVSFHADRPQVLRPGGVPLEEIERLIGPVRTCSGTTDRPISPGCFPRHYAPRTPVVLAGVSCRTRSWQGWRVGLLTLREPTNDSFEAVETLSAVGDLREAAARLYDAMRRLDSLGLDLIVANPVPDEGLGIAINDRLRRAAATGYEPFLARYTPKPSAEMRD